MNLSNSKAAVVKQAAGGLAWAMFLVVTPMEFLVLGAVAWIPLLIYRERLRAARYGFWPGIIVRSVTITAIVLLASWAPTKTEDRRVGPLSGKDVILSELVTAKAIYSTFSPEHASVRIQLPSASPTRSELIQAINQQTGFRASILHCANGGSILFGSGVGRIRVVER